MFNNLCSRFSSTYGFGGIGMGIFMVIIAVVAIILVIRVLDSNRGKGISGESTPLDTLKKRYAKGEVTKAEFDAIKADLKE